MKKDEPTPPADADTLPPDGKPVALNTPHARAMLRDRFAAPEWALMEEVAPRTGGSTRMAAAVAAIGPMAPYYWIDMESGVRDDDNRFSLDKCQAVCEAVYGVRT